jgi:hypothetical protein
MSASQIRRIDEAMIALDEAKEHIRPLGGRLLNCASLDIASAQDHLDKARRELEGSR